MGRADSDEDGRRLQMAGITIDITEHRQMDDASKQADHREDEFLAMFAHELRNPLAPIVSGLEIVQEGNADEAQHTRQVIER